MATNPSRHGNSAQFDNSIRIVALIVENKASRDMFQGERLGGNSRCEFKESRFEKAVSLDLLRYYSGNGLGSGGFSWLGARGVKIFWGPYIYVNKQGRVLTPLSLLHLKY